MDYKDLLKFEYSDRKPINRFDVQFYPNIKGASENVRSVGESNHFVFITFNDVLVDGEALIDVIDRTDFESLTISELNETGDVTSKKKIDVQVDDFALVEYHYSSEASTFIVSFYKV